MGFRNGGRRIGEQIFLIQRKGKRHMEVASVVIPCAATDLPRFEKVGQMLRLEISQAVLRQITAQQLQTVTQRSEVPWLRLVPLLAGFPLFLCFQELLYKWLELDLPHPTLRLPMNFVPIDTT